MNVLDLYKSVLQSAGMSVDDDGLISIHVPEQGAIPVMVNDKRLTLPTQQMLRDGAFNGETQLIAFHPMCENVVLQTAPVLEKLQTAMQFRLFWVMCELMMRLTELARDRPNHKNLKMREQELLSVLSEVDDKTAKDFTKIIRSASATGNHRLLTLYVRQGGMYNGERVSRLAKFYPSIVDEIKEEGKDRSVFGVNLRKADIVAFRNLIEYILPNHADPDQYASPSSSMVAPNFQALLKTYYKVAHQFNKIIDLMEKHLPNADELRTPLEWIEEIQDLSPFREVIPTLPGNDGASGIKQASSKAAVPAATTGRLGAQPDAAPAPKSASGRNINDFLASGQPQRPTNGFRNRNDRPVVRATGFRGEQRRWEAQRAEQDDLPEWAQSNDDRGGRFTQPRRQSFQRGSGSL